MPGIWAHFLAIEFRYQEYKEGKKKSRANSNSKGSEETNDSETAESDLISIEVAKRTRAVRRLQSNAKGLQVSQSEVSLVKLVES